jgi:hypothetical protein
MKNWKTTLFGLLSAVATSLIPVIQGKGFEIEYLITGAVLGILGYLSKDYDTTGVGKYAEKVADQEAEYPRTGFHRGIDD